MCIFILFLPFRLFSREEVVRKTICEGGWGSDKWTEVLRMRGCFGMDPPFQWSEAQKKKKNRYTTAIFLFCCCACVKALQRECFFIIFFFFPDIQTSDLYQCLLMWLALIFAFQGTALFWPQKAVYLFIFILIRFINVTIIFLLLKSECYTYYTVHCISLWCK